MRNAFLVSLSIHLTLLAGCGASALDKQVTAANIARVALDLAADSTEIVCDPAQVEARENPAESASRCLRALEGHDSSRAAWNVWVTAIIMSDGDASALETAWGLAAPVLASYGELSEFLAEFDIELPNLSLGEE